jgi:hypothetical protein
MHSLVRDNRLESDIRTRKKMVFFVKIEILQARYEWPRLAILILSDMLKKNPYLTDIIRLFN